MKQLIILTIIAVALVGVVVFLYRPAPERPSPEVDVPLSPSPSGPVSAPQQQDNVGSGELGAGVTYSDSGYSPARVKIKKGDTVVFDNKSSKTMWTASAVHPTHKAYPGSDIAKCGTTQAAGLFDACKGYGLGESWEFRFDEQGTWRYHNHLQPGHTGTITVE